MPENNPIQLKGGQWKFSGVEWGGGGGRNFEKESMKVNWHFHWGVWRKGFATNQGLYSFKLLKFHNF